MTRTYHYPAARIAELFACRDLAYDIGDHTQAGVYDQLAIDIVVRLGYSWDAILEIYSEMTSSENANPGYRG